MDLSTANAEDPSASESPPSSEQGSTAPDPAPFDILAADSTFYGLAAELAHVRDAVGPRFAQVMNKISSHVADSLAARELEQLPQPRLEGEADETTTVAQEIFQYRPLEDERTYRLLILYPGDPSQPLTGRIEHDFLRQQVGTPGSYYCERSYDAVSYAWNSDARTRSICVGGRKAMITQSLFDALIRFRQRSGTRRIWADGLCINQEDAKERAAQVALMPRIYTYAAKVLVYLGEQKDRSELVPQFIETVIQLDADLLRESRPEPSQAAIIGLPTKDDPSWEAIVKFFCRPWFSRIWIIQEIILARNALFYCGDWELKFWQIAEMGNRFDNCRKMVSPANWSLDLMGAQNGAASVALMSGFQKTRSTVATRLSRLEEDIALPSPASNGSSDLAPDIAAKRNSVIQTYKQYPELWPLFERMVLAFDSIHAPRTPILIVLGVFSRHEASIPRDRLFALVGLAGDVDLKDFPPDYEEAEAETNARFSRVLVEKGQGIDVLYHATKHLEEWRPGLYPSWSPIWTIKQSFSNRHWLTLGWAYSSPPGGFVERPRSPESVSLVEGNPHLLKVRSSRLGRLQVVERLAELNTDDIEQRVFVTKVKQYFERVSNLMSGPRYFTGESWVEVQCRTLTADHMRRRGDSISEVTEDFLATRKKFCGDTLSEQQQSKLLATSWASDWYGLVHLYAACKTVEGFVGLVPIMTSEGDEIVMIEGSDLPFVLRPIRGVPGCYFFIGGCYMHGLMMGEGWKHVGEAEETLLL